jgi:hypothetical protein
LFGETTGCLLVEIASANTASFESTFKGLPWIKVGWVTSDPVMHFADISIPVGDLIQAFNTLSNP